MGEYHLGIILSNLFAWRENGGIILVENFAQTTTLYKEFVVSSAHSRNTTLFWSDCWWDQPLQNKFPELSSFRNNNTVSLQQILNTEDLATHFNTPLSRQAFLQFNTV